LCIAERYWRDLGQCFSAGITRFLQNLQSQHLSAGFGVDLSASLPDIRQTRFAVDLFFYIYL